MVDKKYIDIHSHILSGMDDGAKSMQESLEMLRIAEQEGIRIVYATPHYMPGKGRPSKKIIEQKIEELQKYAKEEKIGVTVRPGAEYYYMEEILELFEQEQVITLGNSNYVLIEFEPFADRLYIKNALCEILAYGYIPILAHVERYRSLMTKDFLELEDLHQIGVQMQINSRSVEGKLGLKIQKNVRKLLKKHLVDYIATDAHSTNNRRPYIKKTAELVARKYGEKYRDEILFINAIEYL